MDIVILILQILATVLGSAVALLSVLLFLKLHWPTPFLWFTKLYASALSPVLAFVGVLVAFVGLITGSIFISLVGLYVSLIFLLHVYRVTRPPYSKNGFEQAFGLGWERRITIEQKKYFLSTRTQNMTTEITRTLNCVLGLSSLLLYFDN